VLDVSGVKRPRVSGKGVCDAQGLLLLCSSMLAVSSLALVLLLAMGGCGCDW
jgi:hypothetical protein